MYDVFMNDLYDPLNIPTHKHSAVLDMHAKSYKRLCLSFILDFNFLQAELYIDFAYEEH